MTRGLAPHWTSRTSRFFRGKNLVHEVSFSCFYHHDTRNQVLHLASLAFILFGAFSLALLVPLPEPLPAPTTAPLLPLALALAYLGWSHAGSETMDTDTLTGSVVFAEWIFHGLVALGLMLLRARRPELPRPYRSLAYPLAPALYLVTATLVVFGNLWASPFSRTGIGLGVLLAGALVYRPWRAYLGAREP